MKTYVIKTKEKNPSYLKIKVECVKDINDASILSTYERDKEIIIDNIQNISNFTLDLETEEI